MIDGNVYYALKKVKGNNEIIVKPVARDEETVQVSIK